MDLTEEQMEYTAQEFRGLDHKGEVITNLTQADFTGGRDYAIVVNNADIAMAWGLCAMTAL